MNEIKESNPNRKIVHNSIRTPDGTVICSRNRHDYVTHKDKNGKTYMVDGGFSYLRRNLHQDAPYEELSLYNDEPHEELRSKVVWGALLGIMGGESHLYIPIKQMSKAHINNIIDDGYKGAIVDVMRKELRWRESNESKSEAKRMEVMREGSYG